MPSHTEKERKKKQDRIANTVSKERKKGTSIGKSVAIAIATERQRKKKKDK